MLRARTSGTLPGETHAACQREASKCSFVTHMEQEWELLCVLACFSNALSSAGHAPGCFWRGEAREPVLWLSTFLPATEALHPLFLTDRLACSVGGTSGSRRTGSLREQAGSDIHSPADLAVRRQPRGNDLVETTWQQTGDQPEASRRRVRSMRRAAGGRTRSQPAGVRVLNVWRMPVQRDPEPAGREGARWQRAQICWHARRKEGRKKCTENRGSYSNCQPLALPPPEVVWHVSRAVRAHSNE